MKRGNNEDFCLSAISDTIYNSGYLVSSSTTLLPLIKELDIVNPEWLRDIGTQKQLNIKINAKDLIDASNGSAINIINFLISGLDVDDESIRTKNYIINKNQCLVFYTEFQEGLEVKKNLDCELRFGLPILLLCGLDGIDVVNYMMENHPAETNNAINELRNALKILGLPMRSRKKEINSLFQKFDLEEKISNNNKVGKSIKI